MNKKMVGLLSLLSFPSKPQVCLFLGLQKWLVSLEFPFKGPLKEPGPQLWVVSELPPEAAGTSPAPSGDPAAPGATAVRPRQNDALKQSMFRMSWFGVDTPIELPT